MAVSRITGDDTEQGDSGSVSGSFSYTTSSGTTLLVVAISFYSNSADDVTATFNGTSLTRRVASESGSSKEGGAILTLANPDIGTYTLAWDTGVSSLSTGVNIFAYSYQGTDNTFPDTDSTFSASSNQTLNIAFTGGASGDMMFGIGAGFQTSNSITGNGQTLLNDLLTNDDYGETIQKAWGSDNDLEGTDFDFGFIAGIVMGASAAGAAGPKLLNLTGVGS